MSFIDVDVFLDFKSPSEERLLKVEEKLAPYLEKGYRVVAQRPIEEIFVRQLGNRFTLEKEKTDV